MAKTKNSALSTAQPTPPTTREDVRAWFHQAKFGLFIHWGIYAVPGRGEWLRSHEQITEKDYARFRPRFNPKRFNPDQWAALAQKAGVKYMVFTTKHHDGFCMFDAHNTDWKVTNTPYGKDILAEVTRSFENRGITVGYYYSIMDWHHPDYLPRLAFEAADRPAQGHDVMNYIAYMREHLKQIVTEYRPAPFVLWYDGGWLNTPESLGAAETNAMVRQLKPDILINDRHHTKEDLVTPEQRVPPTGLRDENGNPVLWEACMTMTSHWWGYDRQETKFKEKDYLIRMFVDIVAKGGNFLLNVGPKPDGTIQKEFTDRLLAIGKWLDKYSEAIFDTTASPFNRLPFYGRATVKGDLLYVHVFTWPKQGYIQLPNLENNVLDAWPVGGRKKRLPVAKLNGDWHLKLPPKPTDPAASVIAVQLDGPPRTTPVVIRPNRRGQVELPALYGDLAGPHGQRIRYEERAGDIVAANWYRAPDSIEWDFELPTAGSYRIDLQAIVERKGAILDVFVNPGLVTRMSPNGLPYVDGTRLDASAPSITFTAKTTKPDGQKRQLGKVTLPAGTNKLKITLKDAAGTPGLALQSVTLVKCR